MERMVSDNKNAHEFKLATGIMPPILLLPRTGILDNTHLPTDDVCSYNPVNLKRTQTSKIN